MKISEEIAEILRDEIVAGVYKPRERLIEEDLSEKFFVSRTPIREALRQLEAAGLVKIEPYKGAFIADKDMDEIRDIYELRSVLEAFATELAVKYITADTINQMQSSIDRMFVCMDSDDKANFAREDELFHQLIHTCCPNKVAVQTIGNLLEMTAAFRRLSWRTRRGMENSIRGHQAILDAIRAGDAVEAGRQAAHHIRLYLKDRLDNFQQ